MRASCGVGADRKDSAAMWTSDVHAGSLGTTKANTAAREVLAGANAFIMLGCTPHRNACRGLLWQRQQDGGS
jgi:hypothetical protein